MTHLERPISQTLERGLSAIEKLVAKIQGHSCPESECGRLGRILCATCLSKDVETLVCHEHVRKCDYCGQWNCPNCANMHNAFCGLAPDLNDSWKY